MICKIFIDENGNIKETKNIMSDIDPFPNEGILVNSPASLLLQYWDIENQRLCEKTKPNYTIQKTNSTVIISGIFNQSEVFIDSERHDVFDNEIEIIFDTPGKHRISIYAAPYLQEEINIET